MKAEPGAESSGYQSSSLIQPMVNALSIFSGLDEQISPGSAMTSSGLCAYMDILKNLSLNRELLGQFHIVPGKIDRNGQTFDCLTDHYEDSSNVFRTKKGELVLKNMHFPRVSLVLEESLKGLKTELSICYKLHCSGGNILNIPPSDLTANVLWAYGLIECDHHEVEQEMQNLSLRDTVPTLAPSNVKPNPDAQAGLPSSDALSSPDALPDNAGSAPPSTNSGSSASVPTPPSDNVFQTLTMNGRDFALYSSVDDVSRCAAVEIADIWEPGYRCILQDRECLQCSLRAAVIDQSPEPLLLVSNTKALFSTQGIGLTTWQISRAFFDGTGVK
jgi:hypothetical protein